MPRYKFDRTKKYAFEIAQTVHTKVNYEDIIFDLNIIYPLQLKRFKDFLLDDSSFYEKMNMVENLPAKITNKCRAYIFSAVYQANLVMMPIDESVFDNLCYVYDLVQADVPEYVNPNYISTLFLFKDKDLVGNYDITASQLATLMAVFKNENLVNYSGARYDFYGKPRKNNKNN